jgi:hypothetical protein
LGQLDFTQDWCSAITYAEQTQIIFVVRFCLRGNFQEPAEHGHGFIRETDVAQGDSITLRQGEVFDYVWKKADGTREGNTTAAFLD